MTGPRTYSWYKTAPELTQLCLANPCKQTLVDPLLSCGIISGPFCFLPPSPPTFQRTPLPSVLLRHWWTLMLVSLDFLYRQQRTRRKLSYPINTPSAELEDRECLHFKITASKKKTKFPVSELSYPCFITTRLCCELR